MRTHSLPAGGDLLRLILSLLALYAFPGCEPTQQETRQAKPTPEPEPSVSVTREIPVPPFDHGGKTLLMHYMPWYETPEVRGRWGSHWTGHQKQHNPEVKGPDGLPDIWSHYHPLIGLYDSTDPAVLECQLLQMKLAGVDGVIVDWYGIADVADYRPIHVAAQDMFLAAGRLGMTFAACYEDRSVGLMLEWGKLTPEAVPAHLTEMVQWMQKEWFPSPLYFRLDGAPLLLNFGPIAVKDPAIWAEALGSGPERPKFFGLHHLWKNAGGDGGFTWVHWEPWNGEPSPELIQKRLRRAFTAASEDPSKVIVSAYPGFNDVYEESHRQLDRRDGQTLRETLQAGMEGPWRVIQLVTWNDYGEGTVIEPTHETGYTDLELIQEARRKELGAAFTFTPDDLRLPARLLALRRTPGIPSADLDRVAGLLGRGDCPAARKLLEKIEARQPAP